MGFRGLLAVCAVFVVAACAAPTPVGPTGRAVVYVIERGWHTDIGLPVAEIAGPLTVMEAGYPGVRFLTFGFGERQFVVNPHKTLITMLGALLPSKSAVLMTALAATPEEAFGHRNVVALHVSQASLDAIEDRVWREIEHPDGGPPVRLANGPYPGSSFYPGRDTYSAFFTCNTWTADTLRAGGLAGPAGGIVFSGQVMDLARRIGARP